MTLPASPEKPQKRTRPKYIVRPSGPDDYGCTSAAAELVLRASQKHHIAARSPYLLSQKITAGHAVLALQDEELIGFAYAAVWNDNTASHSAVVVREDFRRHGVMRKLKTVLLDIGKKYFPDADLISLTNSPAIAKVNTELGYKKCSLSELSTDPEYWAGCKGCMYFDAVNKEGAEGEESPVGTKCCCDAMRLCRDKQ